MEDDLLPKDDKEALGLIMASFVLSLSCLSPEISRGPEIVPGVFGGLVEEPNDAKAPVPSPNAEEAPVVGEATAAEVEDVIELKGLALPPGEDVSPPKRLVAEKVRGESVLELSRLPLGVEVVSESLLELEPKESANATLVGREIRTLTGAARDYPLAVVNKRNNTKLNLNEQSCIGSHRRAGSEGGDPEIAGSLKR